MLAFKRGVSMQSLTRGACLSCAGCGKHATYTYIYIYMHMPHEVDQRDMSSEQLAV